MKEIFIACITAVVFAAAMITMPQVSFAKEAPTMVYTDPTGALTLLQAPCTEPTIIEHMNPQARALFKAGTFTGGEDGIMIPTCWAYEGGVVYVTSPALAAIGATMELPASMFKPGVSI